MNIEITQSDYNIKKHYHSPDNGGRVSHHAHEAGTSESHNHVVAKHDEKNKWFPLYKTMDKMKKDTEGQKIFKQLAVMSMNLSPALTVNEIFDSVGKLLGLENLFDYVKPVSAIFSRQIVVDGVDKSNLYKPVAASIGALGMLGAQRLFELPKFLLRPVLAVILYGIESFENIQYLFGFKKKEELDEYKKVQEHLKEHTCSDQECDNKASEFNEPSWKSLSLGLGIIEAQLNTVSPLVTWLDKKLFNGEKGILNSVGKVIFNTGALSLGFTGVGSAITGVLKKIGNKYDLQELVSIIESIICPCCGVSGACANTVAEDVTTTYNY